MILAENPSYPESLLSRNKWASFLISSYLFKISFVSKYQFHLLICNVIYFSKILYNLFPHLTHQLPPFYSFVAINHILAFSASFYNHVIVSASDLELSSGFSLFLSQGPTSRPQLVAFRTRNPSLGSLWNRHAPKRLVVGYHATDFRVTLCLLHTVYLKRQIESHI